MKTVTGKISKTILISAAILLLAIPVMAGNGHGPGNGEGNGPGTGDCLDLTLSVHSNLIARCGNGGGAGVRVVALAAVAELNIRNALFSKSGLEDIVSNSLENSARFLHFLDSTEPFSREELTAFVLESGLVGVEIVQPGTGQAVSGPTG